MIRHLKLNELKLKSDPVSIIGSYGSARSVVVDNVAGGNKVGIDDGLRFDEGSLFVGVKNYDEGVNATASVDARCVTSYVCIYGMHEIHTQAIHMYTHSVLITPLCYHTPTEITYSSVVLFATTTP
jgi:hypothetical protein